MDVLWRIEMFGGLRVAQGEHVHSRFRTQKSAALLAYLALRPDQSHARERLIDLFWQESELDEGRNNLSTALSSLRRQLEPSSTTVRLFLTDHQTVQLNASAVTTDLADFESLVRAAARASALSERADLLERAVGLYRGELLPGRYEDWAVREQERLAERYVDCLRQWSEALEALGDLESALAAVKRIVDVDPLREDGLHAQIRLYGCLGRPAAAVETYRQMEERFKSELGALPSPETRELAELLRRDPHALLRPGRATAAPSSRPQGEPARPGTQVQRAAGADRYAAPAVEAVAPSHAAASDRSAPAELEPEPPVPFLPPQMTRFFGRQREVERLKGLLSKPGTRLITLLGPGGAGKTRLAIEAAQHFAPAFAGRVWFVSLAELPDPQFIPFALANALQLRLDAGSVPLEKVVETLQAARSLLVMDNFEHLLQEGPAALKGDQQDASAADFVRVLLERVPNLICLVTSRQPLHLGGEQEFPVPPLGVPAVSGSPAEMAESESVALYVDRAQLAKPDFELTEGNAGAVAILCRKLEGMPLAIEMAAAWAGALPPTKMLERLETQFHLLVSRRRDLPARHQSLRATIEWSYQLLSPPLQTLFARLSVFRGRWTLETAESVCADEGRPPSDYASTPFPMDRSAPMRTTETGRVLCASDDPSSTDEAPGTFRGGCAFAWLEPVDVLPCLAELQERSLLVVEEQEQDACWRMLEPLREFALEKLEERGERDAILRRHALRYLRLAEQAVPSLASGGAEQPAWYRRLDTEADNLRVALDWCLDQAEQKRSLPSDTPPPAQLGLRIANASRLYWFSRGMFDEAIRYLRRVLAAPGADECTTARGRALFALAWFGGAPDPRACLEESLAIHQKRGDRPDVAQMLHEIGCRVGLMDRDYGAARPYFEESLKVWLELGDRQNSAAPIYLLGCLAERQGDYPTAREYYEEAVAIDREFDQKAGNAPVALAHLYLDLREYTLAESLIAEVLENGQTLQHKFVLFGGLELAARLEKARGNCERAAYLLGAAASIAIAIGEDPGLGDPLAVSLKSDLGEKFLDCWKQGRALTVEQAVRYALTAKDALTSV